LRNSFLQIVGYLGIDSFHERNPDHYRLFNIFFQTAQQLLNLRSIERDMVA